MSYFSRIKHFFQCFITTSENKNIRNFRGIEYDLTDPKFKNLSKKKIKSLLRDEQWEAHKDDKKRLLREKKKEHKKQKQNQTREGLVEALPTKKRLAATSQVTNVRLVIDCSFNHLMTEREMVSFVKQLGISYGRNRTAPKSAHFYITSLEGALKNTMNEKWPSWKNWKQVRVTEESYLSRFQKKDLVYLSADAEDVIEELEEGKAYIIGGIVDKNRHKNLCQSKAMEQGIKTARLPIGDYLDLSTRKVLTVNQVCEILLKWLDVQDWEKSIRSTLPGRKLKNTV